MRIKTKILSIITATLVLVVFVSLHYSQKMADKDHEAALKEDAAKIIRQVGFHVPSDGVVADTDTLDDGFKELFFLSPHLIRIDTFLLNSGGHPDENALRPFLSRQRYQVERGPISKDALVLALSGQTVLDFEETTGGNYVNAIAPLHNKGRVYGVAELKISHEEFYNLVANKRQTMLFVTVLAILVLAGVLVFSMDHMVSRPIQGLLSAIARVKGGDLGVRVESAANDEIGTLSEHFNSMIETIERDSVEKASLMTRINRHNDELKERVRLATDEIMKRNEALRAANQSIYNIQKKLGHSRRLAAVGQLAATVAHRLGTPLHSVSGHLQLLMEDDGVSKDAARRLGIMQTQIERMTESIQDLLDTTRQQSGRMEPLEINDMIEDISILVMPEALSRQITLHKDLMDGLLPVAGSSDRLQEAFLNLVDNAIDASCDGGVVTISSRRADAVAEGLPLDGAARTQWVKVTVRDNGKGIAKEDLTEIFEPFYTTKAHGRGTGLGLSIAKETVESHHGRIRVESMPDAGSAFTVYLPSIDTKG